MPPKKPTSEVDYVDGVHYSLNISSKMICVGTGVVSNSERDTFRQKASPSVAEQIRSRPRWPTILAAAAAKGIPAAVAAVTGVPSSLLQSSQRPPSQPPPSQPPPSQPPPSQPPPSQPQQMLSRELQALEITRPAQLSQPPSSQPLPSQPSQPSQPQPPQLPELELDSGAAGAAAGPAAGVAAGAAAQPPQSQPPEPPPPEPPPSQPVPSQPEPPQPTRPAPLARELQALGIVRPSSAPPQPPSQPLPSQMPLRESSDSASYGQLEDDWHTFMIAFGRRSEQEREGSGTVPVGEASEPAPPPPRPIPLQELKRRLQELKRARKLARQISVVSHKKWPSVAHLVECPPQCTHRSGECARTCASCGGSPINDKPAVQCPSCELYFCDVACRRRTQCPHDGSLCDAFVQDTDDPDTDAHNDAAAAGLGCQCVCCCNRWPLACEVCECCPCLCAGDGVAWNGVSWRTRYAPWISNHCELRVCAR